MYIMITTFVNIFSIITSLIILGGGKYLIYSSLSYSFNKKSQFIFYSFLLNSLSERGSLCIVSSTNPFERLITPKIQ
jgi:hypothetical protein